jgi:formylmethanofuran dehydrogenase subunit E
MKVLKLYIKQLFCNHYYQADKQITFIKCNKCGEKHWYEKNVDIYK